MVLALWPHPSPGQNEHGRNDRYGQDDEEPDEALLSVVGRRAPCAVGRRPAVDTCCARVRRFLPAVETVYLMHRAAFQFTGCLLLVGTVMHVAARDHLGCLTHDAAAPNADMSAVVRLAVFRLDRCREALIPLIQYQMPVRMALSLLLDVLQLDHPGRRFSDVPGTATG